MIANSHNTRGECQRCGRVRSFVLACAFNADGSFRFLCSSCDRVESWQNQRRPLDSISAKAGKMERNAPLFFGLGDNPILF
jgi:hypothetical protein